MLGCTLDCFLLVITFFHSHPNIAPLPPSSKIDRLAETLQVVTVLFTPLGRLIGTREIRISFCCIISVDLYSLLSCLSLLPIEHGDTLYYHVVCSLFIVFTNPPYHTSMCQSILNNFVKSSSSKYPGAEEVLCSESTRSFSLMGES